MSKLLLFTTPNCHKCPSAKELVKTHNLDCMIIEVGTTPGGENKALQARVRGVPQFVRKIGAIFEKIDLDDEESFNKMVEEFFIKN